MNTSNHRGQDAASQAGRKRTRRGRTARISEDIAGAFKTISDKAGAGPARTGKGKRRRGLRGRLLPAVLCHPRLGWRDMILLAIIYALEDSGPDAGLRGGITRVHGELGGSRYRWGKRVKRAKRMKLIWLKPVRGEQGKRIVATKTVPRTFWRAICAKYRRLDLERHKPKGKQRGRGLARLGSFNLPPGLLTERRLTPAERAVLALLLWMQSWRSVRRAWPATRTIARWLKMRLALVGRSLKGLEAKGYIVETGKTASGVRIWAVRETINEVTQPESRGDPTGIANRPNRNRITAPSITDSSIACATTQKPPQVPGTKSDTGDKSGPAKSPQIGTAAACQEMGPRATAIELQRQRARLDGQAAIEARDDHATRGQSPAAAEAEAIRNVVAGIDSPENAVFALEALGMSPKRARLAVKVFKVPMVRGTILLLADRIERGERILNYAAWITTALREGWARPVEAANAGKVARADAVNAPAEIEIEWTPEARAALETGRLRECTEQEAVERAIACVWPRLAWSVWADVIRHSDPATAAALKSYLAATCRDVPASLRT